MRWRRSSRTCLAFDRAQRYQSASDLAEDLERFLKRRPLRCAINPSRRERAGNWLRRNWLPLCLITLTAALLVPPIQVRVLQMIPIERRWAMNSAAQAVGEGHFTQAVAPLRVLLSQYPRSPLPRLLLGIALDRTGARTRLMNSFKSP